MPDGRGSGVRFFRLPFLSPTRKVTRPQDGGRNPRRDARDSVARKAGFQLDQLRCCGALRWNDEKKDETKKDETKNELQPQRSIPA